MCTLTLLNKLTTAAAYLLLACINMETLMLPPCRDFRFVSDDKQELTALHMIDSSGHVGEVPTGVQFALKVGSGGSKLSVDGDAIGRSAAGSDIGSATMAAGTATAAAAPAGLVSSASLGASQQGVRPRLPSCSKDA